MKATKIIRTLGKRFSALRRRYGLAQGADAAAMTVAQARAELRPLGVVIRKVEGGAFRVSRKGGGDVPSYTTDDITDAVESGRRLAALEPDDDQDDDGEAEPPRYVRARSAQSDA